MLRAEVKAGSELGKQAKAVMDAGNLVDDSIVLGIVRSCMTKQKGGWILDGFPRTVEQADKLSEMLMELHQSMDLVICMVLDDDILIKRGLARGRADDTEEVLKNRLEVYRKSTQPLIDYYSRLGLLINVDASGKPAEILAKIEAVTKNDGALASGTKPCSVNLLIK